MRLLIVEDEPKTANYLKKGLGENRFVVDVALDGEDGYFHASNHYYDLIILDVMLPRMDGWTVLTKLRQQGLKTPILFLTAQDSVAHRVKGLEHGADDYLVKPFAFSELLARIRALLRRGTINQNEFITIADLEIDLLSHKAVRSGLRLDLAPKEFALLSLLARRVGEVISRTVISELVWDMNFDCDTNVVDVAVRRLRSKVDDPFTKKLIHTIRGVGYVMEDRKEV